MYKEKVLEFIQEYIERSVDDIFKRLSTPWYTRKGIPVYEYSQNELEAALYIYDLWKQGVGIYPAMIVERFGVKKIRLFKIINEFKRYLNIKVLSYKQVAQSMIEECGGSYIDVVRNVGEAAALVYVRCKPRYTEEEVAKKFGISATALRMGKRKLSIRGVI